MIEFRSTPSLTLELGAYLIQEIRQATARTRGNGILHQTTMCVVHDGGGVSLRVAQSGSGEVSRSASME